MLPFSHYVWPESAIKRAFSCLQRQRPAILDATDSMPLAPDMRYPTFCRFRHMNDTKFRFNVGI
ncbi:hypothetical protein AmDm5_0042 [Acetobacter malorum]|nr:hypothetical protein AmDm5_0042 [Acetobacter malorum]